jgi:hypothetical protein
MIIACPECSGPFEIPDDRIAALVQIECPHCTFRMILDFAAANDPSLVEEGMQMASGFRSAADYRAAASGAVAEPALRPAPPPPLEEVTTRPEPGLSPRPAELRPVARETEATRPEPARRVVDTPLREPTRPEPSPSAERFGPPPSSIPTPIEQPAARRSGVTEIGHVSVSPPREPAMPLRGDTQVGPAPGPPIGYGPDYDEDVPTRVHDASVITPQGGSSITPQGGSSITPQGGSSITPQGGSSIAAQAAELPSPPRGASETAATRPYGGTAERRTAAPQWSPPVAPTYDERQQEPPPEEVETRPEAELPISHTHRPAVEIQQPRVAAAESYDDLDAGSEYDDLEYRKGSVAGTVIVTILLLVSLGLLGASLALKNTADPRPLLEDLYRQYMKR